MQYIWTDHLIKMYNLHCIVYNTSMRKHANNIVSILKISLQRRMIHKSTFEKQKNTKFIY